MSRLDFCKYELVDDCYDWKNNNCDKCNIFKAYCEGAIRVKNSIVQCKDCRHWDKEDQYCINGEGLCGGITEDDFCSKAERRKESEVEE